MPTEFETKNLHRFCPEDQQELPAMMYMAVAADELSIAKSLLDSFEAPDLRAGVINTIGYVSQNGSGTNYITFDEYGSTMLALVRSRAMGQFLIENGADLIPVNKSGETQQVTAKRLGNGETVKVISDHIGQLIEQKLSEFLFRQRLGLAPDEPK